jgi:hypothetical protein
VNRNRLIKNLIFLSISLFCLLSCGLEEFYYIHHILDGTINDNTSARIRLPAPRDGDDYKGYEEDTGYFTRFEIYYRIYISGVAESGEINTSALRSQINSSLNSDFESLRGLTDKTNTSIIPTNLDTTFSNRRYFKLTLENFNIDNILGRGSLGQILDIRFSPINGVRPVLMLSGGGTATYILTYTGTAGGQTYTLIITHLSTSSGDSYELTVGSKKSTGTVAGAEGGVLTLRPSNPPYETFTATVSRNGLTELNDTITWTDGTQDAAPGALTAGGGIAIYTYTGTVGGQNYTLEITQDSTQDSYVLTVGAKKSEGTVESESAEGDILTLKSSNPPYETFTATVSINGLTGLNGTITWTDGTQNAAPGNTYTLQRAVSGPSMNFNPKPDRIFLNHPDLYNTANLTNDINADVAANTPTTPTYTYVSMYIFAAGKNPDNYTTIYSLPTHIGIFRLAEAF